jgi:hypothetical protein
MMKLTLSSLILGEISNPLFCDQTWLGVLLVYSGVEKEELAPNDFSGVFRKKSPVTLLPRLVAFSPFSLAGLAKACSRIVYRTWTKNHSVLGQRVMAYKRFRGPDKTTN